MCGIAGYWSERGVADELPHIVRRMARAIETRGPDDAGIWVEGETGLAIAHQRLAILDRSLAGHQPMLSTNGDYVIAFNGEIYNHMSLREALEKSDLASGHSIRSWQGHSDTETLLAALSAWGVEESLKQCVGMFAFALWDRLHHHRKGLLSLVLAPFWQPATLESAKNQRRVHHRCVAVAG